MIRRSFIKTVRRHLCSAFGAAAVAYSLYTGASNNLRTVLSCAALALCLYGIVWAIDRIAGNLSPIIVDISAQAGLDRSNPYEFHLQTNGSAIMFAVDDDEAVYKMQIDDGAILHPNTKEYCFLKVGTQRLVKCDPEMAYKLVRKLRNDGKSPHIKGLSYQA